MVVLAHLIFSVQHSLVMISSAKSSQRWDWSTDTFTSQDLVSWQLHSGPVKGRFILFL